MNGGYILVDCKGLDLLGGSTPQEIEGIHDTVKKAMATGKSIRACNCTWGEGLDVTPIDVLAIEFADEIICTASTLQVHIFENDTVTVSSLVG